VGWGRGVSPVGPGVGCVTAKRFRISQIELRRCDQGCIGLQVLCCVEIATGPALQRNARHFFPRGKLSLAEPRVLNARGD